MIAESFLDTNILFYAALGRDTEEAKRARAKELLATERFGLSAQVLQEFFVNVTRKTERPMTPARAMEWLEQLDEFPCVPIDRSLVKVAAEISVRFQLSYWDAALIAAAELLGAQTLYTEDLNHNQLYGSVRVVNPFRNA
jgi:predicted nucleic acid-binding protein